MYGCIWFSNSINSIITVLTEPVMVCFFVLSGFSIRMSSYKKSFSNGNEILSFYKKRLLALLPPYYLLNLCYAILIKGEMKNAVLLFPVQLFGIQASFRDLFGTFTFGGTWFVSCILIAYLVYPLIHQIIPQLKKKTMIIVVILLLFLRCYADKIVIQYNLDRNYSNPFFRLMEFAIGVLLYDLFVSVKKGSIRRVVQWVSVGLLAAAIAYCGVERMDGLKKLVQLFYPTVILFACVLFLSLQIHCEILEKSKVLAYMSSLTYPVYLMQMLAWNLSRLTFKPTTNFGKIVCSLLITLVLSVIVERMMFLLKKALNKRTRSV